MDDKNRLNDGEKPQTPADREAKAKRRILVGIAAGALLVASLITGGIYLSGRQGEHAHSSRLRHPDRPTGASRWREAL